jgi:hypothetical protein
MRMVRILGVMGVAACVALSGTASAQSTKGAGKVSISFIKWPVVNIQAKAAGSFSSKPAASVAGKAPTGGTTAALKFAKEIGDPTKPGLAPGDYALQIETGVTPDGDVGVSAFVTFTIDPAFKCSVHAAPSVDGDTPADPCQAPGEGGTEPLCAPIAPGKCTFTTYQAAGIPNYTLGPGDGQPTASRLRVRTATLASCATGDIILGGTPVPATSTCGSGSVVAVGGIANGDITP